MKKKMTTVLALVLFVAAFFSACKPKDDKPDLPKETRILNRWIWDTMNDIYLWESTIPNIDPMKQEDPEAFFYALLNDQDKYSWIVDDYEELLAMFDGVELSNGMSARPGEISENKIISIVEYVIANSPAAEAGIKRGDIIVTIDGQELNKKNYYSLFNKTTATFGFGEYDGTTISPNGKEISLTAIELNQNPVLHHEVIDYNGQKAGYLVYSQFTSGKENEWLDSLNTVFESFKTAGVATVIMDLRYNPGGSLDLSSYIANVLSSANAGDIFVKLVWNDFYNQFWPNYDLDEDGVKDGINSPQLVVKMPETNIDLGLDKLYFLTTASTASASESLMTGLYPYVDVVQIGETTYGKCYASITITDLENPKRHNWAMQPIVLKYTNAEGYTDFVNGISPEAGYQIMDDLLQAKAFGDISDPMLAAALKDFTGENATALKSTKAGKRMPLLPVRRKMLPEKEIKWPESDRNRLIF